MLQHLVFMQLRVNKSHLSDLPVAENNPINLLLRFYDIDSGAILVDGYNTKNLMRSELRAQFGMVLRIRGSLREPYGRIFDMASLTPRIKVEDACRQAQAHEFIVQLPQGYDTKIGEGGGSLSQGQQQLLCIARVMLADPPILLLDEATSSIDTRTEKLVQTAFDTMMEGRTSLVVATDFLPFARLTVSLCLRMGHN